MDARAMRARYEFDRSKLDGLPLSLEFQATLPEWHKIKKALEQSDPDLRPLRDCVQNLLEAIEDATGHGYKTRGYSYNCDRENDQPQTDE